MKVFISWSGELSLNVAKALYSWIPQVLQMVEPFLSEEDIESGTRWNEVLGEQLESMNFGVICVTRENMHQPWLNFEAGALAKSRSAARVIPFLIDLGRTDLTGPLVHFQSHVYEKTEVRRLVGALNRNLQQTLPDDRLNAQFDKWWPDLRAQIDQAVQQEQNRQTGSTTPQLRGERDMIEEILELSRQQQRALVSADLFQMIQSIQRHFSLSGNSTLIRDNFTELVEAWGEMKATLRVWFRSWDAADLESARMREMIDRLEHAIGQFGETAGVRSRHVDRLIRQADNRATIEALQDWGEAPSNDDSDEEAVDEK